MRVTQAVWPFRLSLHCLFLLLVAGLFVLPSQAERKTATLNQTNSAAGPAKPLPTRVRLFGLNLLTTWLAAWADSS